MAAIIWFWPDAHEILTGAREFGAISDGEMIGYGVATIPLFSGYYFFVLTVPTRAEKGEHHTKGVLSLVFSAGFFICLLAFFEWFHVESL